MKNVKFASISDQLINTAIIMDMMFNTEVIVKDMKGGNEDMTEKRLCKSEEKIEIRPFFLSDIMKVLSEIEKDIWDNRPMDKVKIQNKIILLKSLLIGIDKEGKDIITVEGLKYKRVFK